MSTQSGTLRGPRSNIAAAIVESALTMTREQAENLSCAYDTDPNTNYLAHCAVVQDALAVTNRTLSLGWFEQVFRFQDWTLDTKALHAVADAVMAALVSDIVSADVVNALSRPWFQASPDAILQVALRS